MEIRAITAFTDIDAKAVETPLAHIGPFMAAATHAFEEAGVPVQTRRLATSPFPQWCSEPDRMPELAAHLLESCTAHAIHYIALGPAHLHDQPACLDILPAIFRAAPGAFASIDITNPVDGIDLGLLRHTADVIREVSTITDDGLTNLYLAAIANCKSGSPFFPAAYHGSGPARFALAIEAADLAVEAFQNANTPEEAKQSLTDRINEAAARICPVADALAANYGLVFGGLDFSLAPYPGEATSLGNAMEQLGVTMGGAGLVAAASIVMNAVEAARFPRCGFSGLMLPVLEDTVIGRRVAEGTLHLNDLLLYSAICGTGLDCIPLPGDVAQDVLTAVLLDVGALALRLNKPLTARLMPLPGKSAGDLVTFPNFEYFVPSRVITPPSGLGSGVFRRDTSLRITPRQT